MGDNDWASNPFAEPSSAAKASSAFSDPSITAVTGGGDIGEYNPFVNQTTTSAAAAAAGKTTPVSTASYIPPAVTQAQQNEEREKKKQEDFASAVKEKEIEAREAELRRREAELNNRQETLNQQIASGQVTAANNWPPFPKFCPPPLKPCQYHNIKEEIPVDFQSTCKYLYWTWLFTCWCLFFNFIAMCGYASMSGADNVGVNIGLAILYVCLFPPAAHYFWYRTIYNGAKKDRSINFLFFFFVFFWQVVADIFDAIGINGYGASGWIIAYQSMDKSAGIATLMYISAICWTIKASASVYLLIRTYQYFRSSGKSLEKAQSEGIQGAMQNDQVRAGVTSAATTAATTAAQQHFGDQSNA